MLVNDLYKPTQTVQMHWKISEVTGQKFTNFLHRGESLSSILRSSHSCGMPAHKTEMKCVNLCQHMPQNRLP